MFASFMFASMFFAITPVAHALDVTVLGGANIYTGSISPDPYTTSTPRLGFGFGALTSMDVVPLLLGVETGVMYVTDTYNYTIDPFITNGVVTTHSFVVPVLLKLKAVPYVDFGVGPYLAMGVGSIGNTGTLLGVVDSDMTKSYAEDHVKKLDFGLDIDARAGYEVAPLMKIVLDVQYRIGLLNVSETEGLRIKNSAASVMAGLNVGF